MLCRSPWTAGPRAFPCGQCMPCRFNRRRVWTHRLLLEQLQHGDSAFCTLTYNDDTLPPDSSLDPKHVQDWLKRFRRSIYPVKIRYYLVGEYGDVSHRPHYHVALFGYPSCRYGISRYRRFGSSCCDFCDRVRDTWGFGHVYLGVLERHSCQYVAGYVTKKLTKADDPRLGGRHPEFARMSNRPGLGHDALFELASEFLFNCYDVSQGDVPVTLRHGACELPLGRYLRRKLRSMVGRDVQAPASVVAELQELVRPLYEAAEAVTSAPGMASVRGGVFRDFLVESSRQKAVQLEARARIFKRRATL